MSRPRPTREELRAMVRKYRTLAALRRSGAPHRTAADRAALRAVADEFPGALRELDTLELDEMERRAARLEDAAEGGETADWMAWAHAYRMLMRAALATKAGRAPAQNLSAEAAAAAITRDSGIDVDSDFARAVLAPPDGRVSVVVFERLGILFGRAGREIWDALFPSRRPRRY